jgi:hypothetical protein
LTLALALAASLGLGGAACAVMPTTPTVDPAELAGDAAFCVDEVNRLRATVHLPALVKDETVELFSSEAAKVDGQAHEAHKYFLATNGGNGMSRAQNEIPWWSLARFGNIRTIIRQGLEMQWAEGAGGLHYINLVGPYTQVGCGIAIANGEVTVTQDFR